MVGSLVGHFRVIAQIGAGGMGIVYEAHDERLDRSVALKVLPSLVPVEAAARRRFRQEALALSRLNHPNIATVHDFDTFDNVDVLVMEYIAGVTLSDRVKAGPLSPDEVIRLGVQLAAGLQAAHEQQVIHRDLKPGNLRVTPDGRLKILDFGIARLLERSAGDESTHTATDPFRAPGTLPYMAPEQLRGQPPAVTTDIYSAGAALYELATGHRPFTGPHALVIDRILNDEPDRPAVVTPRIPACLEAVIVKAMDKRPDRRYQSARELLVDLERCGDRPAPRRSRAIATRVTGRVAVTALLVVAAAFAGWLRFGPSPSGRAPFPARGWVLVSDFDNRSGDAQLDQTVRESVVLALEQSAYVNVFSRGQVFDVLRRMKRSGVTRIDEGLGLEICRRENGQVLLAGAVLQSGGALRISMRALEPATGRLFFTESVELSAKEQLFAKVDLLARRLRERLGEPLSRIDQASAPLEKVTTGSLEALQRYTDAVDAIARGSMDEVPGLLQAALALDPDFAMARRVLARVFDTLGQREKAVTELDRAYALRASVTPRERYLIEAAYYTAHERYDEAAESLTVRARLYPDDPDTHYELAVARYAVGRVSGAIEAVREDLRLNPRSVRSHEMLVLLLARAGAERDALDMFQKAVSLAGPTPRLHWGAGMAWLGLGEVAKARKEFLSIDQASLTHGIAKLYLTRTDLYEGRLRAAALQLAADITGDHQAGRASAELLRRYLLARIDLLQQHSTAAREEAARITGAPETAVTASDLKHAARVFVLAGDLVSARTLLGRLHAVAAKSPSASNRSFLLATTGEIALAEGRVDVAIQTFRASADEYRGSESLDGLARAYQARGDWAQAESAWTDVINLRGEILRDGFPPDLPMAHRSLARVYEHLARPDRARLHSAEVSRMWAHADPMPALAFH